MGEPILVEQAKYIISPLVKIEYRRGGVVFLDEPGHVQEISPAREWYEPIEDEL